MMIRRLIILLLIVGCAPTKPPIATFYIGMTETEFTELNKDKITNVIISDRLTKSPVLMVADESGMDINMEKLMKLHNQKTPESKKILELNANHPMIIKISESLTKTDHKKISTLILDQANILDGNILSNPANYIETLTELFIK